MKRIEIKDLAYWKAAALDMAEAYQQTRQREFLEAVRYANRKISQLEQKAFSHRHGKE